MRKNSCALLLMVYSPLVLVKNSTNQNKMKIQAYGYTFNVEFHADEKEYCATWQGFSGYGRTPERAIATCHALMKDTLLGDDDSE